MTMTLDQALALCEHASPMPHLAGQALRVMRDEVARLNELTDRFSAAINEMTGPTFMGEPVLPHPDNTAVDAFAVAMKAKLAEARAKGRGGWQDKDDCPQQRLSDMLRAHLAKGDPRDVANFCMFLHQRGEAILPAEPVVQGEAVDEVARLKGVIERDRTVFCNLIAWIKRELQAREWLGNENARAAGGYRYDEPGFIREFGEAWTAIMEALGRAHNVFRNFSDCPSGDALRTAQAEAETILSAKPLAVPAKPAERQGTDREALLYLMQQFDSETWQCPRCGHAEDTATMDSADFLRKYLKEHPTPPVGVPDEKPLPELMLASYHEVVGWNACRAAMLAAAPSPGEPKSCDRNCDCVGLCKMELTS